PHGITVGAIAQSDLTEGMDDPPSDLVRRKQGVTVFQWMQQFPLNSRRHKLRIKILKHQADPSGLFPHGIIHGSTSLHPQCSGENPRDHVRNETITGIAYCGFATSTPA